MRSRRHSFLVFWSIQAIVVAAFAVSYAGLTSDSVNRLRQIVSVPAVFPELDVPREKPLEITPLYDDPTVVNEEDLAAVLKKVRPVFQKEKLSPNYVEHALRTWGRDATFQDPHAMSGREMEAFLVDYTHFLPSWDAETEPLMSDAPQGVAVRWGSEPGGSVHHDHTLACLTEGGIPLHQPVITPTRQDATISDVLRQALYDFRYDERETEWSVMSFGLWLPPQKEWREPDGRRLSFDRLARRLLRGHNQLGVCGGTHRVYSLLLLIRVDDEFDILSDAVRNDILDHLKHVRDLLVVSQFEDGHWPYNWPDGKDAVDNPANHPSYRSVISTGHHLEWLAVAPKELHPPHEQIVKAAQWLVKNTTGKTQKEILSNYTFYSHVGNALALWRGTHPAAFWHLWQETHPYQPETTDSETAKPDDAR